MVDEAFRKRELPKPMRRLSTPAAPRHGAKEPEEDHYDRVKAFLRNWSINTDNAADMMRCTLKQRDTVMAGFEPSDSNNDINVELNQWIWKVLQTTGPALPKAASPPPLPAASPPVSKRQPTPSFSPTLQPAATEMEEPAQHWEIPDLIEASIEEMGLNEKAASLLRELPVDQQEHAIASFEPSATTRDINGAFIALLKRSYGNRWHAHSASETVQPQGTSDPIEAFIQQMGLNEEAVSRLQELPVDQQMHAIASFEPNATTRDVNGAFIVLLKRNYGDSRHAHSANGPVQPQRSPNPIEAFIEEMGLNEKAVTLLGELPVDQQMHAIASFQPTATTRDINGAFIALLKRDYGNSWYAHSAMMPVQPQRTPDPIEAFIEEMGLNEKAVTLLRELPVDQQMHAIASFQPTATTRDINGAFIALLKRDYGISWYAHSAIKLVQPQGTPDPIEAFIEEMGLNEKAVTLLGELPVDQQMHAIASFQPTATTRDINGAFIALLKRNYGNSWYAHSAMKPVQPRRMPDPPVVKKARLY